MSACSNLIVAGVGLLMVSPRAGKMVTIAITVFFVLVSVTPIAGVAIAEVHAARLDNSLYLFMIDNKAPQPTSNGGPIDCGSSAAGNTCVILRFAALYRLSVDGVAYGRTALAAFIAAAVGLFVLVQVYALSVVFKAGKAADNANLVRVAKRLLTSLSFQCAFR